jgi:hypothetical protein
MGVSARRMQTICRPTSVAGSVDTFPRKGERGYSSRFARIAAAVAESSFTTSRR